MDKGCAKKRDYFRRGREGELLVESSETLEKRLAELIDHFVDSNAILGASLVVIHAERARESLRFLSGNLTLSGEVRLVTNDNEDRRLLVVAVLDVDLNILFPVLDGVEGAWLGDIENDDNSTIDGERKEVEEKFCRRLEDGEQGPSDQDTNVGKHMATTRWQ